MPIYGTALLSICLLIGLGLGRWLAAISGLEDPSTNIGGVGIAMLLLITSCDFLQRIDWMQPPTESGIAFWSSIYVPIVVAMAASQDVLKAVSGGWVAALAGIMSVVVCFGFVALFARLGQSQESAPQKE